MSLTPSELLDSKFVHSISSAAICLDLLKRNGEPNRAAVHLLIREGKLALVDPTQCISRWTVSSAELRRYASDGPRTGAERHVLRTAS